jgi:hypothetical protein
MSYKLNGVFSIALMTALSAFQTPVNSETVCNGLVEAKCTANASCIWVNSYTTKKGTQVNGYCRVSPGNKTSTSKAQSKEHLEQAVQDS